MKQTRVYYLTFIAGQSSTTQYINIPIKVRTIHTKAISLNTGTNGVLGTEEYITLTSDLVNNAPLGSTFNYNLYAAGTIQDIENQLWNPQVIQGYYTFTLYKTDGTLYPATAGNDTVAVILEFNAPDEVM